MECCGNILVIAISMAWPIFLQMVSANWSLQMHTNVNGIHIEHLRTYGTYERTETMKICKTLLCKSFANNLILLGIITKQQAQTEADICDVKEILM